MWDRRKHEKVIAVILDDINSSFSRDMVKSMMRTIPEKKNINLVILSGKYVETNNGRENISEYKSVYNSVFKLGEQCEFDGVIIHIGSMDKQVKKNLKVKYSESKRNIPKVFIASDIEGETTVNYDNTRGISEAIEYLINVNGFTRICMLGGREDNKDAFTRKQVFLKCLKENNVMFSDTNYEVTDMSSQCTEAAAALLDRNPDVQAIFCVNDSVARGLYRVMESRNLVPGKDILVFGFDNTVASSEMTPSLSSVGAYECTLGDKAMELMLRKLNGENVKSALVSTRLYGRDSLYYEMYDYTVGEMINIEPAFIYRMFRDCFYRYRKSPSDRENVNLERLFYEIISLILKAIKRKYMSIEEYNEVVKMINKFFEKGAMKYTDAQKLLESMDKLQKAMNNINSSSAVNAMINSLFLEMKDNAITALSEERIQYKKRLVYQREELLNFLIARTFDKKGDYNNILMNINKLGVNNAALYMFEKPLVYDYKSNAYLPDMINLKCIVRDGEVYLMSEERQLCRTKDIFVRDETSMKCRGFIVLPVFYKDIIYGFLMCEAIDDIYERGEFIALQLGKTFYINSAE